MAVRLNMKYLSLCVIILLLLATTKSWVEGWTHGNNFTSIAKISSPANVTLLVPGVKYVKGDNEEFYVYCFQNVHKSVFQIWRSVQLVLLDIPLQYDIFHGVNESEVHSNFQSKSIWHPFLLFSDSEPVIEFPAFSQYCIGIASKEGYSLLLKVRTINYWKVLQTLLGVFLFLSSPVLSRNTFFHYASGVSFGVLASFLIILYVFSRFIPQKSASYAVLVFGYSFVLYFLKVVWHHLHDIVSQHMDVVLGYCIVTAFLSFVVFYRIGPVKNERTCNIIQWSIQVLSLMLIFFSSEYRELSTAVILLLLSLQVVPTHWIKWVTFLWYRCFPPRPKFLSDFEYNQQGHFETERGLEKLRNFCSSPECNVWKVVRKLKDPVRFANFIETGSHHTEQELLDYNSEDFSEYPDSEDMTDLDGHIHF